MFLPVQVSDTKLEGFEPAQNLHSGFVEYTFAVVVKTTLGNVLH